MSRRLIINADDFGLTHGVNRAVRELTQAGSLTSATLMAHSDAFDDAIDTWRALPNLGVGCHVVLTDGTPVCEPETVPSLMGKDGKNFRSSLMEFWFAVLLGRVSAADMERETSAQIRKLQQSGIEVTHVDTHKHTHILPQVARAVLNAAERCGIRAIRNPFEQDWSLRLSHGNLKRHLQVRIMALLRRSFEGLPQLRSGSVVTTDGTIGISATGNLNADVLHALLSYIPEGTWELVCHPGYNDRDLDLIKTRLRETRDIEREALQDVFTKHSSHPFPIELIHYGMLKKTGDAAQPAHTGGNLARL